MNNLVIDFSENVKQYDNNGAHEAAKLMMKKYENMTVQFKTGKDRFPYAWLESRSMAGFKLILNAKELDEDADLQISIFKQLIEKGKVLQFVPKFRETNGFVTAYASFKKGKVVFRLKETDELNEYLAEKELI